MDRIPPIEAFMSEIWSMYSGRDLKKFETEKEYNSKTLNFVKVMLHNLKAKKKEKTLKWLSVGVGEGRDLEVLYAEGLRPYLLSWGNVPGKDSERLLSFLMDDLDIGWTKNAGIIKTDDGKTIRIFKDENSAELLIDEGKEKAILKISDDRTYDLKVKKENDKLNIYLPPINTDFYGIDISDDHFETIKESASKLGIPEKRVHLEKISAEEMKFNSEFDLVSAILVLHEVDPVKLPWIIKNMLRALKKDGTLVISDFQKPYELEKNVVVWDVDDIKYLLEQISPKSGVSFEIMDSSEYPEEFGFYSCIIKKRGRISPRFFHEFEKNIRHFISLKIDKTLNEKEELENQVKQRVDKIIGEKEISVDTVSEYKDQITEELEPKYVMKLFKIMLLRNQLEYLNKIYKELAEKVVIPPSYVKSIKRTYLPTIESVLKKEEPFAGDFFKKEPEWVDFEEGFVVERKEVDGIIQKLKNDNIQLVLGEPASGKSTILKNIGFKLVKENKDVYVVELKKHSRDDVKRYFWDILGLRNEKAVFIVDDAHLLPTECERLVREFKNKKLKIKLIIGSRETRELRGEHPKEASEFEYLSKTDIHVEDVTEEMIKRFLKGKYAFSDDRIERVSKNLEEYKKDLWFLSWTLKAYNPKKESVEEVEIYKKIRNSIREIKLGKEESGKSKYLNAEDAFLPLSVFYRFEIPIERDFLEEQMGIKGDMINQLIELSEIVETEERGKRRTLSLIHSSIAELYFRTYQNYHDFGRNTKKLFQEDSIEYSLFFRYINSAPTNSLDVSIHLGRDWLNKKGGRKLLKKLIEDKEVKDSIIKSIEKEKDVEKIGLYVWTISKALSKEAGLKLANRIDTKSLLTKIEKEEDIQKIGHFVEYVTGASEQVGLKLANRINIDNLLSKIEKEEDIEKIGWCVWGVGWANEEVALRLVDAVLSKIEKEEDIEKIWWCVSYIAEVSEEMALKLVDAVSSKVEKEEDVEKIGFCVREIADVREEVGLKLANRIDVDNLLSKIEREEDIKKIGSCVWHIAVASEETALKLVDAVSSKVEKEEDAEKIGLCMKDTAYASEVVAQEIINRINPKLRAELQERRWLK